MTGHEFGKPSSPQEHLAAAKVAFRGFVLQNDTVFSILQARLSEPGSIDADLPDFGLEPTLRRNTDNTSTIGLRHQPLRYYQEGGSKHPCGGI